MITAFGINKFYGDLHVLKNVSININESEMVSIVGVSGAGKTTLLQILGTLETPTYKENTKKHIIESDTTIYLDDVNVLDLNDKELSKFRNNNIGFIFQFHNLLPEFSALENVAMPSLIKGETKSKAFSKAKDLLSHLNLSHRFNHKPSELSGGEKQRVSIARALINNPKIIFADEPSGSLDSKNSEELNNLFLSLKKDFNKTFVIVTHNMELAKITDRIFTMVDGQIVSEKNNKY